MANNSHDDMLFEMLKDCKTLPVFLDHIFGFLKRRSDFYVIAENPSSSIGLPPGLAEALIKGTYQKYLKDSKPAGISSKSIEKPVVSSSEGVFKKPLVPPKIDLAKSYNGANYNNYSWSQNHNEIDLTVYLPANIKSKDLIVELKTNKISVKLKDGKTLIAGDLLHSVNSHPYWSINGRELVISFEKSKEIWWNCFLTSEPKLDINKMECTKSLDDFPDEDQAKIQELQWNQEQKMKGLPTSEEMKNIKLLEKAWAAEGSPFSGPFDPSQVKFN